LIKLAASNIGFENQPDFRSLPVQLITAQQQSR